MIAQPGSESGSTEPGPGAAHTGLPTPKKQGHSRLFLRPARSHAADTAGLFTGTKGCGMKGMVFTEFLDMVEAKFSPAMADQIIGATQGRTGGAYTAVGNYDHSELVSMVLALSQATQVPVSELIRTFGHHMAGRFAALFGRFFSAHDSLFGFLASVDSVIHVEVLKLYPDAQLPSFKVVQRSPGQLVMDYESSRHLHDLALGLIEGAAAHFGEQVRIQQKALPSGNIRFDINLVAHAAAA